MQLKFGRENRFHIRGHEATVSVTLDYTAAVQFRSFQHLNARKGHSRLGTLVYALFAGGTYFARISTVHLSTLDTFSPRTTHMDYTLPNGGYNCWLCGGGDK